MTATPALHLPMLVEGESFDVELSVSPSGEFATFTATIEGKPVRASEWAVLHSQLKSKLKKSRKPLDIPIVAVVAGGPRRGTIYSVHAGTGQPMVRWAVDGSREQFSSYSSVLGALDDDEFEQLVKLHSALSEAQTAADLFEHEHKINLRELVREATQ